MSGVKVGWEWLSTGCCWASDLVTLGRGWRLRKLPLGFGIIRHPQRGVVLLDLGMAPRVKSATSRWPYWLYRLTVPYSVKPEQTVLAELEQRGYSAAEVETVLVSHFHVDHIAGLLDFPRATVVCHQRDWASVKGAKGFEALRKACFPDLLPEDLESRLELLEDQFRSDLPEPLDCFRLGYDYFGDGSCWLIPLPGHSPGHMGAYLQTEQGPVMVAVDTCWRSESFRLNQDVPALVHRFLTADPAAFRDSLQRLHNFHRQNPQIPVLLAHCPESFS